MTRDLFSSVWDAFSSIPSMRAETLVPLVLMLILWIALNAAGVPEDRVFVLVLVLAQAYAVWRSLPVAARHMRGGTRTRVAWPVVAVLMLAALQLVVAAPIFSQRLLSAACLFVLLVMVLGLRREKQIMDRVMTTVGEGKPVSLLRVNAVFALVVLCVNEALIASGSLTVWMVAMMLAALVVHAAYWFTVLLLMPREDKPV